MKRGEPLKRLTRLTAKKPMARGKGLKAGGNELKRTTAKPKRARRTGPPPAVMALLAKRSGGWCELGIVCLGNAQATDPSHRIAKGMGGTKDPRSNTAANNTHACRACHDVVERDPAAAYANGWKIRRGLADPTDVPVRHWVHGWVRLDVAGGWSPALEYAPEGES
ncbi:hypothetical protein OG884_06195 [Streptosporangium sp. NBC_01755]|uniref:hypothetical protein n=1 Tax=Streptosporangium sp. NBC_01755 TaxID=2975949 RepID=UPI002DD85762|nr:hypothetical protein [Streptosporangium sp. NBC_01755]WSD01518.1 hypothetical protein OG884_06195 [Streptosporangium sp. NBC_01755]